MSRETFKTIRFRPDVRELIDECNAIVDDYLGQGLRLTLRQLYYQLVSKNRVVNDEKSYKRIGGIVSDARLAGLMDWAAIEDRNREPLAHPEWSGLDSLVDAALNSYRLPRWGGQKNYVELWVEKAALAGVLQPLAYEYHVTLMVNRGYSSQSAMYESAKRFIEKCRDTDDDDPRAVARTPVLFYLGDHDPSGEDMVRDIRDRMVMFGVEDIDVVKLALTKAQINQYNPPPNPAKITDPRASAYIEKHGRTSWEVDALNPSTLARIVRDAFKTVVDVRKMKAIKSQEEVDKADLTHAVQSLLEERA